QRLATIQVRVAEEKQKLTSALEQIGVEKHVTAQQLLTAKAKSDELEKENKALRERIRLWELEEGDAKSIYPSGTFGYISAWLSIGVVLVGSLVAVVIALKGCSSDYQPTARITATQESPHRLPEITPSEIAKYEGKECTVRFTISSQYNGFDW